MSNSMLRNIPSVNELLERPALRGLVDRVSHNVVVTGVRSFLDNLRREVQTATSDFNIPAAGELAERIANWILQDEQTILRPVINATGVLLHTGLGRAPLAPEALQAVVDVARGYASLEVDLETGERSQRVREVEKLLRQLTGAEAAVVVNNNAAATLLTLLSLAHDREVIVSRGQLVEIGGSYRLPDVMSASGARLREVGTTNKTRIGDYETAITDDTAALLHVHTSNYRVVGFTESASLQELIALGRKSNLPVIDDIGSGAMLDLAPFGVGDEPLASDSIQAGADLVLFSGDKLMGGPQCGIIAGRRPLVRQITKHPMMRAMRVGKLTLAALAATLRLYREPALAERSIPLLSLLNTPLANLQNRAERLAPQLASCEAVSTAEPVAGNAYLGGGSVPTQEIRTWCVALTPARQSLDDLAAKLRTGPISVFGRVHKDRLLFDLRSVFPEQDAQLVDALSNVQKGDETSNETGDSAKDDRLAMP